MAVSEPRVHDGPASAGARARILVVDDDPIICLHLETILRPHWDIQVAGDGREALEAIARQRPDLVLTDVTMPHVGGFELLAALRGDERTRSLPVILLSGQGVADTGAEGFARGADDFLAKPFSVRELVARVQVTLDRSMLAAREVAARKLALEAEERLRAALERERTARHEVETASRLKDEFLATVSHELRTPLAAVLSWAQLAKKKPEMTPKALDVIERNARAQSKLIADILDVSRILNGKLLLRMTRVELAKVVGAALDVVRPTAEAKGVALESRIDPEAGLVSADADRVQQIAWNLLANAVKFTPRGGKVVVIAERRGPSAVIEVTDTGRGIPRDFLPHVFESFRQADASTTRVHGGLGLGLAIVRHLTELHGGIVFAQSDGESRGATFRVELPLVAVHVEPAEARGPHERPRFDSAETTHLPRLVGARVLVVDDDPDGREVIVEVLREHGASVVSASCAIEALARLRESPPDVLLSDIGMPGMDGYELLAAVRQLAPEEGGTVPAIALTAYARGTDRERVKHAGFTGHLAKPVGIDELVSMLHQVIDTKQVA